MLGSRREVLVIGWHRRRGQPRLSLISIPNNCSAILVALACSEPLQIACCMLIARSQGQRLQEGLLRLVVESDLCQRPAQVDPGIRGTRFEMDCLSVGKSGIDKSSVSDRLPTRSETLFVVAAGVAPRHGAG